MPNYTKNSFGESEVGANLLEPPLFTKKILNAMIIRIKLNVFCLILFDDVLRLLIV